MTKSKQQKSIIRQLKSRWRKLTPAAPLNCLVFPLCSPVLPRAPSMLGAPSVLPLKRPCSLSRSGRVICNPKFGVYITYIYRIFDFRIYTAPPLCFYARRPQKIYYGGGANLFLLILHLILRNEQWCSRV